MYANKAWELSWRSVYIYHKFHISFEKKKILPYKSECQENIKCVLEYRQTRIVRGLSFDIIKFVYLIRTQQ